MDKQTKLRTALFLLITVVIGLLILFPLKALLYSDHRGMYYGYYSHILLIPLVSAYLFFIRRMEIWRLVKPSIPVGVLVGAIGIISYGAGLAQGQTLEFIDQVAWQTASLLVAWFGAFLIFWGRTAFKEALFPLLFLFFIVPIPTDLMDTFIYALQWGSSWSTAMIFSMLGVSYFQEGFVFQMGKVTIEKIAINAVMAGARPEYMPVLIAAGLLCASAWWVAAWRGLAAAGAAVAVSLLFSAWSYRRIGGATGDTLGAACELSELSVTFTLACWR